MIFSYDGLGRMTSGKELYLGDSANWEENVGYDLNGNIQSLSRLEYSIPNDSLIICLSGILLLL